MTPMDLKLTQELVDEYLAQHDVHKLVPIEVALAQMRATSSGQPAILLAFTIDGKKHVAFTTLQLLETACSAIRAASGMPRSP